MARSSYRTHLSPDRYAKLLGLSPVHFNSAVGGTFWPDNGKCEDIWWEHPWQTPEDFISRSELELTIYNAEQDIERILGYSVAPRFVNGEMLTYPKPYQRNFFSVDGKDLRGANKLVKTRLGKILSSGARAVHLIDDITSVSYSDVDGDTWRETATITVTETDDTDLNEIKVYFAGKEADPTWEIRPIRSITRSGTTVTIKADSWLFINPVLQDRHPQSNERPDPIDISGITNFVSTVDVYREYVDTAHPTAELQWDPVQGFNSVAVQSGFASVSDPNAGYVAVFPALYADGEWVTDCLDVSRDPDRVKVWYYAGALSDEYLAGYTRDPLSDYFATTIMWLATARLAKRICSCGQAENVVKELQRDMTQITEKTTFVLNLATDLFTNPLGTKVGEYRAWQRLARLTDDYVLIGGVL